MSLFLDSMLRFLSSPRNAYVICIFACEVVFSLGSGFRRYPGVRPAWLPVPVGMCIFLLVGFFAPSPFVSKYGASFLTLSIFVFSILLQRVVLDLSIWRLVFNNVAAYAVENLTVNVSEVALRSSALTGWGKLLATLALKAAVIAVCYFLFARKARHQEIHIKKPVLIELALISVFISNFLFSYFNITFTGEVRQAMRIPLAICCFLMLEVQFTTFRDSSLNQEKEVLEKLLFREQRQHKLMQETIDIINMKSHDLKKQISLLKNRSDADPASLISEVEKAVDTYDSLVDTGNRSLDIIISEEKLICNKYRIPFDIMADGAALSFIPPEDLYSLMGNALRNAVENSVKEEEGRRSIALDIHRAGEYICIEISNYCTQSITLSDGFPVTSKKDGRFHGYGLKSMEYVVKKYGGNMVIRYQDDTFTIKILLPKKREESA